MKNSELVSRVSNGFNAVNKDMRIPKRFILRVAIGKAVELMAQKFRDRSLFREANLYRTVSCVEMKQIDKYSCDIVEFRSCNRVMRSVEKLPPLIYSRWGSSLRQVTNIDFSEDFYPTNPRKFRNDRKRAEYGQDHFFYVKDGYLYLPDSDVLRVSLYLYSPNEYDILKLDGCEGEKKCLNPWDAEFIVSDKLAETVIQMTRQEVSSRFQIPEDENPNLDSNIKSKTTN